MGKVASGASRIGFWRYEKERGDRLKYAVCESTLSTAARSPFPNGEGCETGMPLFSHRQSEYTHMEKKNNDGQSLPRMGKVSSGASRIGFWRYERERGRSSQVDDIREHPSAAQKGSQPRLAVPLAPSKGRGSRGHSLLPVEGCAPKGRRLDGGSGMKKSGEIISGRRFTKAPSAKTTYKTYL